MRNFYHPCKFCTLIINFSKCDLGESFCRQRSLQYVSQTRWILLKDQRLANKNSSTWWYVFKTSWRCLQDVFARRLEDVLKTSWRRLSKTSWRCLEKVWTRRIYWSWPRRLGDVSKTSSEDVWLTRIYSSSSRRLEKCLLGCLCENEIGIA